MTNSRDRWSILPRLFCFFSVLPITITIGFGTETYENYFLRSLSIAEIISSM